MISAGRVVGSKRSCQISVCDSSQGVNFSAVRPSARARLIANELAPRVHNSGHWTIEGAETSQFANHLRAVLGLPLGATAPFGYAAMVNLIGTLPNPAAVLAVPGGYLHLYSKALRSGRKLGHVTIRADGPRSLPERLEQLLSAARIDLQHP